MKNSNLLLTIMGTRPQYVKCAVLRDAYRATGITELLLDTGQHYDENMSSAIFRQLGVADPDIKLSGGSQSQCKTLGSIIIELEDIVTDLNPSAIVVLGDTNSTLAGGIVAKKLGFPLLHIEAGLRSQDMTMPEEQNRVMIDHISDYLFCPTNRAVLNLEAEGLVDGVYLTGDVMFDAVLKYRSRFVRPEIASSFRSNCGFDLITLHRAESLKTKTALQSRIDFIREQSLVPSRLFILHPHTKMKIIEFDLDISDFICVGPLGYLEMQWLLSEANHVFTDSGGLQKEAFFHGCRTTTMRNSTEWEETFSNGINQLWNSAGKFESSPNIGEPFGGGDAADRIATLVGDLLY